MIQIDMPMPKCCDDCRFCIVDYTDDDKPDSFAYCCAAEEFIAQACDGKDKVVATAIIEKKSWCPLRAQEPMKPKKEVNRNRFEYYHCGKCDSILVAFSPNYCHKCGQAVKWE